MHDRATADDARNSAGFRRLALLLLAAGALPGALVARAGLPGAVSYAELTGSHFVAVPADPLQAPSVTEMTLPQIPDGNGIWGATGRDSRGHIWWAFRRKVLA